jgi:hypothetical protein
VHLATASVDIAIFADERLPDHLINDFAASLRLAELRVDCERQPPATYATILWFVPTLVVVFLSRKLFDAFMAEAGKDLYKLVKRSIVKLTNRTTGATAEFRASYVGTAGKVPRDWRPPILSIVAVLDDGRRAKFIFLPDLDESLHEQAVEAMLDILRRHYLDIVPLPELGISLDESIARLGSVPLIYDVQLGAWRAVTHDEVHNHG